MPGSVPLVPWAWAVVLALVLAALSLPAGAQNRWTVEAWRIADGGEVEADSVGGLVLGRVDPAVNLALQKRAVDHTGDTPRITDGDRGRSSAWNSLQEEAFNFFVQVDLEEPRLVDRVVVAPVDGNDTDFMKGYSIQTSTDDIVYRERVLNKRNTANLIDTSFAPVLARYVRVQVKAVDNVHKVQLSELEVYGTGFRSAGTYLSEVVDFAVSRAKNLGRARWVADRPEGTGLILEFRTGPSAAVGASWSDWAAADREADSLLLTLPEPRRYLQYRATLTTRDPTVTPRLSRLDVEHEEPLAATVTASVAKAQGEEGVRDSLGADEVSVGQLQAFVYQLRVVMGSGRGFDALRLRAPNRSQVEQVRRDGQRLAGDEYSLGGDTTTVEVRFAQRIQANAVIEVDFRTALFDDENRFRGELLADEQPLNPQEVEAMASGDRPDGLVLYGVGLPKRILAKDRIWVAPNPFSPNGDGRFDTVQIRYELAKVAVARPVTVRVFDLSGRCLRTIHTLQKSGTHIVEWDGRADDGARVPPGMYLFQVDVDSGIEARFNGAIGVVY